MGPTCKWEYLSSRRFSMYDGRDRDYGRVCGAGSAARLHSRDASRRVCHLGSRTSLPPSSKKQRLRLAPGKRPGGSFPGSTAPRGAHKLMPAHGPAW
jgi:hypothetical protein